MHDPGSTIPTVFTNCISIKLAAQTFSPTPPMQANLQPGHSAQVVTQQTSILFCYDYSYLIGTAVASASPSLS